MEQPCISGAARFSLSHRGWRTPAGYQDRAITGSGCGTAPSSRPFDRRDDVRSTRPRGKSLIGPLQGDRDHIVTHAETGIAKFFDHRPSRSDSTDPLGEDDHAEGPDQG
jgi:hypothetical protein